MKSKWFHLVGAKDRRTGIGESQIERKPSHDPWSLVLSPLVRIQIGSISYLLFSCIWRDKFISCLTFTPKTKDTGYAKPHEDFLPGPDDKLSYNWLRVTSMTLARPIQVIQSTLLGLLDNLSLELQRQQDISLELWVQVQRNLLKRKANIKWSIAKSWEQRGKREIKRTKHSLGWALENSHAWK